MFKGVQSTSAPPVKRVGIAADHGGFVLKAELSDSLRAAGYEIEDYGAYELDSADDLSLIHICISLTIASKSVAFRLAPPTSAPPTSGTARTECAFAGFTEPP